MSTRGIHTRPNDGESTEWLTPPEIIKALGKFDLDPCAHPRQYYRTATMMISPPADGLSVEWSGRVWLNPPYGATVLPKWMNRMSQSTGIALVPSRTEVERWFFPFVWEAASAILFVRGRIYFHRPDGSTEGNAGHGSVLVAYGASEIEILRGCEIAGRLVVLE